MYVHGLNSDGNSTTGKNIEKILKREISDVDIVVKHPTFPKDGSEAIKTLKKESEDCNVVIGTSLGGFLALNAEGTYRLVVNPALHPSTTLLRLGESAEIANTYKAIENKLFSSIEFEDKATVIGFFADNDTVVNHKEEFCRLYGQKATKTFHGEHRMNEQNIEDIIVPEIKKYVQLCNSNYFGCL